MTPSTPEAIGRSLYGPALLEALRSSLKEGAS